MIEATRLLSAKAPGIKVIILTASMEDEDLFEALRVGAHGYLLKDLRSGQLLRAARPRAGRRAGAHAAAFPQVARRFPQGDSGAAKQQDPDALTERERDVLELIVEGYTSNRQLAKRLEIGENTVKFHVKNILDKLHLHNRAQAVSHALRHGLVSGAADDPPKTLWPLSRRQRVASQPSRRAPRPHPRGMPLPTAGVSPVAARTRIMALLREILPTGGYKMRFTAIFDHPLARPGLEKSPSSHPATWPDCSTRFIRARPAARPPPAFIPKRCSPRRPTIRCCSPSGCAPKVETAPLSRPQSFLNPFVYPRRRLTPALLFLLHFLPHGLPVPSYPDGAGRLPPMGFPERLRQGF